MRSLSSALAAIGLLAFMDRAVAQNWTVSLPALTQCRSATIRWTGPAMYKTMQAFVQGENHFLETLDGSNDLSGTSGSLSWLVDLPAGLAIGVEIRDLQGDTYGVDYASIQPGSTGECLAKNPGLIGATEVVSFASSLSSASPQLFTYSSTSRTTSTTSTSSSTSSSSSSSTSTSSSSSSSSSTSLSSSNSTSSTRSSSGPQTITSLPETVSDPSTQNSSTSTSSTSTSSPIPSQTDSSSGSDNTGAIAGGIVGGIAVVIISALGFYWIHTHDKRKRAAEADTSNDFNKRQFFSPSEAGYSQKAAYPPPPSADMTMYEREGPLTSHSPISYPSHGPRYNVPEVQEDWKQNSDWK